MKYIPLSGGGGSGTGKTHTLVARVAFLLRRGASPGRIICLTPTDRGAEDLRRRLEIHPDTRGPARRVYVGTFHQYANQILRNGSAAVLGFTPDYTVWDQQRAVETLDLTLSPRQLPGRARPDSTEARLHLPFHWVWISIVPLRPFGMDYP